jgi:hypothetical protein
VVGDWQTPRLACQFFEDEPDWDAIPETFLKDAVCGSKPLQSTGIKTAWTLNEWRVLFNSCDTDAWASLTQRDAPLYKEEVVEIFLDPIGDQECYFEIEVNPLNTVCDLVLRRTRSGYRKSFAWNCDGLRTAVTVNSRFWLVEISIPFASLAPDLPKAGKPWRANFCRIDRPKNALRELSAWSPTGRPNFHVQQRFGWIDFVR